MGESTVGMCDELGHELGWWEDARAGIWYCPECNEEFDIELEDEEE